MKRITLLVIIIILIILIMFLVTLRNSINLDENPSNEIISNEVSEEVVAQEKDEEDETDETTIINHNNSKVGSLYGEEFENFGSMHNGIVPIAKDQLWALINKEGKLLTDFKYKSIYTVAMIPGKPNLGLIDDPEHPFNKMWCLLDENGNEVTGPIIYDKFMFPGSDGYYIVIKENFKYIIISKEGNIISEEFDKICYDFRGESHMYALQKGSLVMVFDDSFNKLSEFDIGTNEIDSVEERRIITKSKGFANNGQKTIYDVEGNIDSEYSHDDYDISEVGESMADGATIITLFPGSEDVENLSKEEISSLGLDGYEVFAYLVDGKYIIFSKRDENTYEYNFGVYSKEKNKIVLECQYDALRYFGNGCFCVAEDDNFKIIDENKNEIIHPSENVSKCVLMKKDVIAIKTGDSWNIYNSKGKKILKDPLEYDEVGEFNFDGLAPVVSYKGKMTEPIAGFIDEDFNLVLGNFENAKPIVKTSED